MYRFRNYSVDYIAVIPTAGDWDRVANWPLGSDACAVAASLAHVGRIDIISASLALAGRPQSLLPCAGSGAWARLRRGAGGWPWCCRRSWAWGRLSAGCQMGGWSCLRAE